LVALQVLAPPQFQGDLSSKDASDAERSAVLKLIKYTGTLDNLYVLHSGYKGTHEEQQLLHISAD